MNNALVEFYNGVKSLVVGLRITIAQFFKPTVTVHYPHQTLKIPARFRGHIELVRDPETGKALCFACKLCERACPSDCIAVEGAKLEGAKRKSVTEYRLDFTRCSLCGSCVEACREGAIRFSREYNLAGTSKEEFIMDLFKRLENEARAADPSEQGELRAGAGPAGQASPEAVTERPRVEPPKPAPAAAARPAPEALPEGTK